MKRRILSIALILAMLLGLPPPAVLTASAADAEVTGISTAEELQALANEPTQWSGSYKLTADIDLGGSANPWTPIGNSSNQFTGTFDGDGHKIAGLYINTSTDYQGLFGVVGSGGTVKNVGVDGSVTGNSRVGGVVGNNTTTTDRTVENCYWGGKCTLDTGIGSNSSGDTNVQRKTDEEFKSLASDLNGDDGDAWADGLNGFPVLKNNVEAPYANEGIYEIPTLAALESFRDYVNNNGAGMYFQLTADIDMSSKYGKGKGDGGADVSWEPIGTDRNKAFTGTFDGDGHKITGLYINASSAADYQGLFGCVGNGGTVKNVGVDGSVTGGNNVGGVVGYSNYGTVENCYNTGAVTGSNNAVGGVVGDNYNFGTVENCYYLKGAAFTGIGNAGDTNAVAIDKAAFGQEETFSGWNFADTWEMGSFGGNIIRPVLKAIPEEITEELPEYVFPNGDGTATSPYEIPQLATLEYFCRYINSG